MVAPWRRSTTSGRVKFRVGGMVYCRRLCESPPAVRSLSTPAELPVVDLDVRVQPGPDERRGREHHLDCGAVAQLDEHGVASPLPTVIGEERNDVLEIAAVD